jgi:hypothetical protein
MNLMQCSDVCVMHSISCPKIQTSNILISKGYPDNGKVYKTNLDEVQTRN